MTLLDCMRRQRVQDLVFCAAVAVYGSDVDLVTEQTATSPMSPYGETKLIGEWLVKAAATAFLPHYALLRCLNVAGAGHPSSLAPDHQPHPHGLRASLGERPMVLSDGCCPTQDGSCVRDLPHVSDLAEAHVAALRHLTAGGQDLLLTPDEPTARRSRMSCRRRHGFRAADGAGGLPRSPGDPRARSPRTNRPGRRSVDAGARRVDGAERLGQRR